ncbi:MAG: 30S ribosomal protein S15 [Saprospiraceae bacterium]|nr:30S ribosomal protein S15 [Saprospiraceae bacterium]
MSSYLTTEKKQDLFKEYGGDAANTGSVESQIALFTFRIQAMSEHLKDNQKDQSCRRALLTLVGKRKKLLAYLHDKDIASYRNMLEKLNIRK